MAETHDELARMLLQYGDQPSTADVNALMPPKLWGGLKSYLPEQPAWMTTIQHNPLVSKFLGEGLPLALMALPGRAPARLPAVARTTPVGEWPTQAAVRISDKVFTGDSHFDAVTKAQEVLGEKVTHRLLSEGRDKVATDGFLTNTGRYVSREEAGRMLDEHNQTRYWRTLFGREKKGGMPSEALELYDPKTGQEKP
jgi:hypothetical protein